jgi:diaminopimelate epimerase
MKAKAALGFCKMHGAGNDFVVLDCTHMELPDSALAIALSHRQMGVGCDQVMAVVADTRAHSGYGYRIFNADGSASEQCGNGARCVAAWLIEEKRCQTPFDLMSPSGLVHIALQPQGLSVTLAAPRFAPEQIPFREPQAALLYERSVAGALLRFSALSLGNPHVVLRVADVQQADVAGIGTAFQQHADFPARANVGFAERIGSSTLRLRVFERGAGETLACGSGACAAVIALTRLGEFSRRAWIEVILPGGTLHVCWGGDGEPVQLAGPTERVFEGQWLR